MCNKFGNQPTVKAAAIVAVVALGACGRGGASQARPPALLSTTYDVGTAAWGLVIGEQVWVSNPATGTVVSLDDDGAVLAELPTGATDPRDTGLALDDGRLWVANLGGSVGVVDVATGTPLTRIDVGPGEPASVAVADGFAWRPLHGPGGALVKIDAARFEVVQRVDLPESAFDLTIADDAVWVAGLDRRVFEIDASTGDVRTTIDVGSAPRGIATTEDSVWVTVRDDERVVRIDRSTGEIIERIPVRGQPWPIAAGDGEIWVADLAGSVIRIDARTNAPTGYATADAQPRAIAIGRGAVWVASQSGRVTRVESG